MQQKAKQFDIFEIKLMCMDGKCGLAVFLFGLLCELNSRCDWDGCEEMRFECGNMVIDEPKWRSAERNVYTICTWLAALINYFVCFSQADVKYSASIVNLICIKWSNLCTTRHNIMYLSRVLIISFLYKLHYPYDQPKWAKYSAQTTSAMLNIDK